MAKANGVSSAFKNNLQNAFNSNWNKAGMRNETYCDRAVSIYIYMHSVHTLLTQMLSLSTCDGVEGAWAHMCSFHANDERA